MAYRDLDKRRANAKASYQKHIVKERKRNRLRRRKYRIDHLEAVRAYDRARYARRREKEQRRCREYMRREYIKHPELREAARIRARNRRRDQPAKVAAGIRDWQRRNPEKIAANGDRRRARKLAAPGGHHTAAERIAKFKKYKGRCAWCPKKATTLDHVVPLARGGSNEIYNCVPACASCNSSKGAKELIEWLRTKRL